MVPTAITQTRGQSGGSAVRTWQREPLRGRARLPSPRRLLRSGTARPSNVVSRPAARPARLATPGKRPWLAATGLDALSWTTQGGYHGKDGNEKKARRAGDAMMTGKRLNQFALKRIATLFLLVVLAPISSTARAQEPRGRVDVGLGAHYMPMGWFTWPGRPVSDGHAAGPDPAAYPAVGLAPFVDYRLNRFTSIGFSPELTLNVIPRVVSYPISVMLASVLRLKVEYSDLHSVVPYVLVTPGYSFLFGCCTDGAAGGDAHGFVASAYAGTRIPIGVRHSIFAEAGYMRGFQKDGGRDYAPSYVVLAAGWQASLQ
jgi:hypothetical protein